MMESSKRDREWKQPMGNGSIDVPIEEEEGVYKVIRKLQWKEPVG